MDNARAVRTSLPFTQALDRTDDGAGLRAAFDPIAAQ